jgi:hypothetical protein
VWGITASDSAKGYVAWGGPPRHPAIDGTVVPCAAAGSVMLAPDIAVAVVRTLATRWGGRVFGRYGFVDAFHPIQRLDESRRDRDRRQHHTPQRREPAQRRRLAVVYGQPGDREGDDSRGARAGRVSRVLREWQPPRAAKDWNSLAAVG